MAFWFAICYSTVQANSYVQLRCVNVVVVAVVVAVDAHIVIHTSCFVLSLLEFSEKVFISSLV